MPAASSVPGRPDTGTEPTLPEMTSRSDLVHPNGVFDLDPNDTYDEYPDIKAYLALIGTTAAQVTWSHGGDGVDTPRQRETRTAVRRGVELLIHRRELAHGYDPDDEDAYAPDDESALPWLRATGFAAMEDDEAVAYLDRAVLSARARAYNPADDSDSGVDDDGDGEDGLNDSFLCGNARVPLPNLLWRPDLAPITPSTPEWVMLVRSVYANFAHPLAILHGLIRETDEPVCTPKLLAERDASKSWLWIGSLERYRDEAGEFVVG